MLVEISLRQRHQRPTTPGNLGWSDLARSRRAPAPNLSADSGV